MTAHLPKIRNRIENELEKFTSHFLSESRQWELPAEVGQKLRDFILRGGKRLRPLIFLCGFCGYSRPVAGLYRAAIALELLHDFVLIHDDIIDGSQLRRSGPSLHIAFGTGKFGIGKPVLCGSGMGIVAGDMLYAMAISCFLSIRQKAEVKQRSLKVLMDSACRTGAGQIRELWSGFSSLHKTSLADVYRIYDLKTAHYSFVVPLTAGAILANAPKTEVERLGRCGRYLGRAFQIQDDLEGLFESGDSGQDGISDLRESKVTLPVWYAYHKAPHPIRRAVQKLIGSGNGSSRNLCILRDLIRESGAVEFANKELRRCGNVADPAATSRSMAGQWESAFVEIANGILAPKAW